MLLRIKSLEKNLLQGKLAIKLVVTETKDKTIILPGLGPKKVEDHWYIRYIFQFH